MALLLLLLLSAAFAALLLLLRVLPGRRPLKNQSLPAFDLPKMFLLLIMLFVLLFVQLAAACAACCLFFSCCCCCFVFLHCFAFSVVCPAFAAAFGSPTVEPHPPLPLWTFQNVKNKETISETLFTSENVNKTFVSQKNHFRVLYPNKTFAPQKKRIPSAYDLISRNAMFEGLLRMEGGDQIFPFVRCFYCSPSTYLWEDEVGVTQSIPQGEGEQGDPLMPMLFALGQHGALAATQARMRVGEHVFAYQDDIHTVSRPTRVDKLHVAAVVGPRTHPHEPWQNASLEQRRH